MLKIKNRTSFLFGIIVFVFFSLTNSVDAKQLLSFKSKNQNVKLNIMPSWLVIVDSHFYDGDSDDLVTAGHGFSRLSNARVENKFNDFNKPTIHELRKAKLSRYINTKNGEGYYFGFRLNQLTPLFDGRIAGTEILAFDDESKEKVAFLLQVPLDFDEQNPCIVAVPTSDYEGIYNAKDLQIRGLWGLKHNCAVVYNDKGLGNALFDLNNDKGYLVNGQTELRVFAEHDLLFSTKVNPKFIEQFPNRFATKQLHSTINSEQNWGKYVINSIEFAFYQLNDMFSTTNEIRFDKANTKVLVYGASDGGGAALKAGEYDTEELIDGIVAVNPQIQVQADQTPLYIQKGKNAVKEPLNIRSLIDYTSYGALYIPCAVALFKNESATSNVPYVDRFFFAENRCNALKEAGLLSSETASQQSTEALNKLIEYGWTEEMLTQFPYHYFDQGINLPYQYISQYGRYSVEDRLCNYSVASIDQHILFNEGTLSPLQLTNFALLWSNNTGSLPVKMDNQVVAIDLVNDDDPKGARREFYSRSKDSEKIDYNLTGAICLNNKVLEPRVQKGLNEIYSSGDLNQIKTIIVHGQQNVKNLPNYSSRSYAALNSYMESSFSNLRYIEVENASYLDANPPFDNTLVPIDYYGEKAMDWLWSNLTKKASLPDSQIVRAKPRGSKIGYASKITEANLVPIAQTAKQENLIKFDNGTIILPVK